MGIFEKWANKVNERVRESEDDIEFRDFDEVVSEGRDDTDEADEAPALNASTSESSGNINLKFARPESFEGDASDIANYHLEGYIVVLDIEAMERADAIRLLDFLDGVTYVTEGTITQRNKKTFVITPSNVNISD